MEVGKLIVNAIKSKAHITVSVKPFGCMPSSGVSDGVQTVITARHPGTIFCAVETSGDGATNFYSRVQMYMFKARIAAEQELARAYEVNGVTEAEVRAFLADNPEYASPLHQAPHHPDCAGSAANLVYEVAPLMKMSRLERTVAALKSAGTSVVAVAKATPAAIAGVAARVSDPEFRQAAMLDLELVRDVARGKIAERYRPIVKKLLSRAYWENNPEAPTAEDVPLAAE
jgi:hypothetical protein